MFFTSDENNIYLTHLDGYTDGITGDSSPPNHEVREERDPQNATDESDDEKFPGWKFDEKRISTCSRKMIGGLQQLVQLNVCHCSHAAFTKK